MANQIGPDDHNPADWFRTKQAARWIAIFSFIKSSSCSKNRRRRQKTGIGLVKCGKVIVPHVRHVL